MFDVVSGGWSVAPKLQYCCAGGQIGARLHGLVGGCHIFCHASPLHMGISISLGALEGDSKFGATRSSVGADSTVLGVDYRILVIVWGALLLVQGHVKVWWLDFVDAERNGTKMRLRGSAFQRIGCSGWRSSF